MTKHSVAAPVPVPASSPGLRPAYEMLLVSMLTLFMELACIRWCAAHVLFMTFFTNTVLLASFLGVSLGYLATRQLRNYLNWTPLMIAIALAAPSLVFYIEDRFNILVDTDNAHPSAQLVLFGTEFPKFDLARCVLPIEAIAGFFFLVVALAFVGPGQELGRAFTRLPGRLHAYTLNAIGSMAGVVLFVLCSWLGLSPFWWFLAVSLGIGYFLFRLHLTGVRVVLRCALVVILLSVVVCLAHMGATTCARATGALRPYVGPALTNPLSIFQEDIDNGDAAMECIWSPYYRVDYEGPPRRQIYVNLIPHQVMVSRETSHFGYALPYLLNRDSGGDAFADVLIIGAGSGNDVSRALQWGAHHVDAVEIDPAILGLGLRDHPDRPYEDPRVIVHCDDGRNFLRTSTRRYDLIVYALVDSLVQQSSYTDIRLESYLFTRQAFADVWQHLNPGGLFVMYNYFRQGWIVARLQQGVAEVFGSEPVVLALPHREKIVPADRWNGFTMLLAGRTNRIGDAFREHASYWIRTDQASGPDMPNGFGTEPPVEAEAHWQRLGLTRVVAHEDIVPTTTDDWPFVYVRRPMIPQVILRGLVVTGGLALLLLILFWPKRRREGKKWPVWGQMFLLGAGFMLLETQAVARMALLCGSTWIVNAAVLLAVLAMVTAANFIILRLQPRRLWPYYVGLVLTLGMNSIIAFDVVLGAGRTLQLTFACAMMFAPVLCAGVIFGVLFRECSEPDWLLSANVAGCMFGGFVEPSVMLLGFQDLFLVALAFYGLAAALGGLGREV
jgi:spermidine synthase